MNTSTREAIRQEHETFEQLKRQDRQWFALRLVMGYSAVGLLLAVFIICCLVIFNANRFPAAVVTLVSAGFLADILALILSVWKLALNPGLHSRLHPVTPVRSQKE